MKNSSEFSIIQNCELIFVTLFIKFIIFSLAFKEDYEASDISVVDIYQVKFLYLLFKAFCHKFFVL